MITFNEPGWTYAAAGWILTSMAAYLYTHLAKVKRRRTWSLPSLPARLDHWQYGTLVMGIGLVLMAMARPVTIRSTAPVNVAAADLVVALDLSRSMLATDVAPSRLQAAKDILLRLTRESPRELRMGLVVFAGAAYIQMPLTTDMATAQLQLSNAQPASMELQGTSIAAALQRGAGMLDNEYIRSRRLWLFTDGENHEPGMDDALGTLKNLGCVVTAVSFGTSTGAEIRNSYDGSAQTDEEGNPVITRPNRELLSGLATATGGVLLDGNNTDEAWKALSAELANASTRIGAGLSADRASMAWIFLLPALLLLLASLLLGTRPRRKMVIPAVIFFIFFTIIPGISPRAQETEKISELEAWHSLQKGQQAQAGKRWNEAANAYRSCMLYPAYTELARYHLALVQQEQQQYDQAAETYKLLMSSTNRTLSAHAGYNYGWIRGWQKKWQASAEGFKQVLRLQPEDAGARENLQYALRQLENEKKASSSGNKPPPPSRPPPSSSDISRQRAEQLLDQLRQREEQLQKQLQKKGRRQIGNAKDW